ncbi:MAG TPA: DNA-processing protein DprA [Gemmatimonadales bacterium]|nr:DNA-processing protein DprA [Gemmatimonadales bacterium]
MDDERIAYLALTQVPGIGAARLTALLSMFDTALGAHSAPFALIRDRAGFSSAAAKEIKDMPLETGRKIAEAAERLGAEVILPSDSDYPALLRNIPDPPPVLFALGDPTLLARPTLAIVGSRDHSSYGASVCRALSGAAAESGIVIASGMARGLDAVAHVAALDAGGTTIGVLGNGLGVIYPAANRALYDRVASSGLLLTEFPPGERPSVGSFPRRNRLISGVSRVTLVVEAAVGSGALITAGAALDQGREVMAVPGNITSLVSAGSNRLIRDGAAPVLEAADLLQHFPEFAPAGNKTAAVPPTRALPEALLPEERDLAGLFGSNALHPDELAMKCKRPIGDVLALISGLEIAGVIEQCPGRLFRRV